MLADCFPKLSRPGGRWEVVASVTAVMQILSVDGARVWRGDTRLRVGETDTVCYRTHFSLFILTIFFYGLHEMHFPGSSFTRQGREISIYIIFNSLQCVLLPTHKTTCFCKGKH